MFFKGAYTEKYDHYTFKVGKGEAQKEQLQDKAEFFTGEFAENLKKKERATMSARCRHATTWETLDTYLICNLDYICMYA